MAKKPLQDQPPPRIGDDPIKIEEPAVLPIRPESVVTVAEKQIPFVAAAELLPQNQTFLNLAMRSVKEKLQEAQKKRVDGRILVEMHIQGGMATGSVRADWIERLSR